MHKHDSLYSPNPSKMSGQKVLLDFLTQATPLEILPPLDQIHCVCAWY